VRPSGGRVTVKAEGFEVTIEILSHGGHRLRWLCCGVQRSTACAQTAHELHMTCDAASFMFKEVFVCPCNVGAADPHRICALVATTVTALGVQVGETVAPDQSFLWVEAMKREMGLPAPSR
jgi:biotin carboxyl carrier protein